MKNDNITEPCTMRKMTFIGWLKWIKSSRLFYTKLEGDYLIKLPSWYYKYEKRGTLSQADDEK